MPRIWAILRRMLPLRGSDPACSREVQEVPVERSDWKGIPLLSTMERSLLLRKEKEMPGIFFSAQWELSSSSIPFVYGPLPALNFLTAHLYQEMPAISN